MNASSSFHGHIGQTICSSLGRPARLAPLSSAILFFLPTRNSSKTQFLGLAGLQKLAFTLNTCRITAHRFIPSVHVISGPKFTLPNLPFQIYPSLRSTFFGLHAKAAEKMTTIQPKDADTPMPCFPLPYLPLEVITLVLSNLDTRDVVAAKQTCRAWYNLIEATPSIWQNPHFTVIRTCDGYIARPPITWLRSRLQGHAVTTLHLSGLNLVEYGLGFPDEIYGPRETCFLNTSSLVRRMFAEFFAPHGQNHLGKLLLDRFPEVYFPIITRNIPEHVKIHQLSVLIPSTVANVGSLLSELGYCQSVAAVKQILICTDAKTWCNGLDMSSDTLQLYTWNKMTHISLSGLSPNSWNHYGDPYPLAADSGSDALIVTNGKWAIFPGMVKTLHHIDIRDVTTFNVLARAPIMDNLRSLRLTFGKVPADIDIWSSVHISLHHLAAPNLETLSLSFPPVRSPTDLKRETLSKEWRLLIKRMPKLKEVTLSPVLPSSLTILAEDMSVRTGLRKVVLGGECLPKKFLQYFTPSCLPALQILDVSCTEHNPFIWDSYRNDWEQLWKQARISSFKPPGKPGFTA